MNGDCKKVEYIPQIEKQREMDYAERRRQLYFLKQKLIGVLFLLGTILMVLALEGDATIAIFTVPVSLTLIFSKEKCWMDQYYFEDEQ